VATTTPRPVDVDERWLADWAAYGIGELVAYLRRWSEFERWPAEHGRE
jgi:hypothetical protein